MKIHLALSSERYNQVKELLTSCGIEIDDTADLILTERSRFIDTLTVKDRNSSRILLPVSEIVLIESLGRDVLVHTENGTFQSCDRLYKLALMLDPSLYLRISNSVIIAKKCVKKITPALTMKFTLTMSNGMLADVTRSYYYCFKEAFGI